jgi:hypothetical protein
MKQSWSVQVASVTIKNCWHKSGLLRMGEPGDSSNSATEPLSEGMSALEQASHVQNFMSDNEACVSANEIINLAGEIEKCA